MGKWSTVPRAVSVSSPDPVILDCSEPQVQWLSSLTAPTAAHLEIEIMGVSVRLEQDPQARQRSSDDSKVEPMKPSTVGTGVIVWVGKSRFKSSRLSAFVEARFTNRMEVSAPQSYWRVDAKGNQL